MTFIAEFTESKILEGEEQFITIIRNGKDWRGALCNQAVMYDNLGERQIKGWLYGHLNIDTGVLSKVDTKLEYELSPPRYNLKINIGDIVRFKYSALFMIGKVVGKGQSQNCFVDVNGITYEVKDRYIVAVNNNPIILKERLLG